ncbi:endonuclease [Alkalitalea saponilacus]|uniref:Endonuclease I n=1 Tax=Alkalitalea saponilacus TaxID=889453 RepID=A0A1T5HSN3_9BACT|nr:endonuclease [Alkalitalea saponilacus]ASB47726.1 ribonuclease [Alkalitalea saponilacus]SKC23657.1 Endonuclease I [Alkalitalea saponilacus]
MVRFLRLHFTVFFLLTASILLSQNPHGYYNNAIGKKEAELKTALHDIIRYHTNLSYSALWVVFRQTDERADGTVWDMYSPIIRTLNTTRGLNREHSFPVSWWDGTRDESLAAYTDINHIFPSDAEANMAKSNHPLGVVGSNPTYNNGMTKVGQNIFPGYTGLVFEPDDEYKGDFARAYLYMATRYQDYVNRWRNFTMLQTNTYPVYQQWAINLLLEWHREDPVSTKELERNEEVFRIQGNRNPFIDFPELAEHIWGNKKDDEWIIEIDNYQSVLITPTNNTEVAFGTVVKGQTATRSLFFRGNNLTQPLSLFLYGTNSQFFNINVNEIPSSLANRAEGFELQVTYSPTQNTGNHTATILVSDGGMNGSVTVNIHGQSIAEDEIVPPTALPATDVTATSFQANWQAMEDTDFYILHVYEHDNGEAELLFSQDDIFDNFYEVVNLDPEKQYSYNVSREVSGIRTEASNTINVSAGTNINEETNDILVHTHQKNIYIHKTVSMLVNARVYNLSGHLIAQKTLINSVSKISVKTNGVYFLHIDGYGVEKVMINH